jgi:chromosome segregation ATPase
LAGKTAGGIMAAGSWFAGKLRPEAAGAAISSRKEFLAMQEGLETGRERLAEARLGFEAARAEHDYAQAMYSPQSFHMRELQDELSRRDQARAEAEIGYLEAAQAVEESPLWRRREAVEQLASSYGEYVAADRAYEKVQAEIKTGEAMRETAARKFETSRAAYAKQRMNVAELEKKLREHPLYGQFVNLKQQKTPGGLDGRWR